MRLCKHLICMNFNLRFIAFILLLSPSLLFAQKEISGRVLYQDSSKPVSGATVTLHHVGSPSILTYSITNDDGRFTLKRNELPDSVTVTVSAMTIERHSKNIKSDIGSIDFFVNEKITELKEVIVKAPKIRQKGDTISYNVSSFLDETDSSIADVLKKLPGIQVLSSGQILYQNKAISKFYVEGLDLMKGKYGIATQNIDAKKVASVEVMENHQPVKALKDMELPDAAAINLKLKVSSLGAFFATAQLGVGLPSVLLSNELVGMRFTRTQQNMLVYKNDNTGKDVAAELSSFYNGSRFTSSEPNLSIVKPSPPGIGQQHHLFNDAHMVSLNDIRTLKKDHTFTSNVSYIFDQQKRDSYSRQELFIDSSDNIIIEEDMNSKLIKRDMESSFTYEANTDDYFVNNTFNFSGKWNDESGFVRQDNPIEQQLEQPAINLSNSFEYLRRKGKKNNKISASIGYNHQNQSLRISPVMFENLGDVTPPLQQNVLHNHLYGDLNLSGYNKSWKKLGLGYSFGSTFNFHSLETGLSSGNPPQKFIADSLRNKFNRNEIFFNFSPKMNYKFSDVFNPYLYFDVKYMLVDRSDKVRNIDQNRGYLLYAPYLRLKSTITPRITLLSNLSFRNSIGSMNDDYRGYIMNNYRSMSRNSDLQNESRTGDGYMSLSYKNPFTTLFASVNLNYAHTWRNSLSDVIYNGILTQTTSIKYGNSSDRWGFGLSLGKSIDAISSEVKLYTNYNSSKSLALHQGIIAGIHSNAYSVSPSISSNISRVMIVSYAAIFSRNHNRFNNSKMPAANYLNQRFSTSFIPKKGLVFNVEFNHYYNDAIESSARSSWFGNLSVRYKMKKVDWILDYTNVFNTKQFVTYSYSDISSYYSVYNMRPAEILLKTEDIHPRKTGISVHFSNSLV
ncbi:hypothetical protein D7D25_16335 [Proteiniphilum sp. X52]|nr:hypothetical protein D7D25_16335 [Proteiniphilum sp. X52]